MLRNMTPQVFKIIFIILLVVVIGAAGFWAHEKGFLGDVLTFGGKKISPQKSLELLEKTFDTWAEIKSIHQKHVVLVNIEGQEKSPFSLGTKIERYNSLPGVLATILFAQAPPPSEDAVLTRATIDLDGDSDRHDARNPKGKGGLRAHMAVTKQGAETTYAVEGEWRLVDKRFYFVVRQVPDIFSLFVPPGVLRRWFSFEAKEAEELRRTFGGSTQSSLQDLWGEEGAQKLKEQLQILDDAFTKYPFIRLVQSLERTKIAGEKVNRYRVEVDREQLKEFILETNGKIPQAPLVDERELTEFNEAITRIEKFGGELWIGEDTAYIYKSVFELVFPFKEKEADGRVSISATSEYSNFNVPVEVVAPEGAQPLEEVLKGMFGGTAGFGGLNEPTPPFNTPDSNFDSDGDGLPDLAEQSFCTDPNNPDTDGDGYLDGAEVQNGYNPNGSGTLESYVPSATCLF